MRREEMNKKIEELETRIFLIEMVDRWTDKDRNEYRKACDELRELKNEMENM